MGEGMTHEVSSRRQKSDWRLATAAGLMENVAFEHMCGRLSMGFQVSASVTQRRLTETL